MSLLHVECIPVSGANRSTDRETKLSLTSTSPNHFITNPRRNKMNNADFIRQYASEIAEALRSQEESPQTASLEEFIPKLYRSLCFDEPIFNDISNLPVVASALSRQLLSLSSPYALSERLVNGIFFLCKKRKSKFNEYENNSK